MGNAQRLVDAELAALATLIPKINLMNAARARDIERAISTEVGRGAVAGVKRDDVDIARPDGTSLQVSIHRPTRSARPGPMPVLLFVHGGSFVTGGLHSEVTRCEYYADAVRCAVISVEYRLAPEHPYPAALDDCLLALHWLITDSNQQDLDAGRVAVGGLSAGGNLAAAVALWCRELCRHRAHSAGCGELPTAFPSPPRPVLQLLLHPVLDASLSTPSATAFTDTPIIDAHHLRLMWQLYLGQGLTANDAPALASPANEHDLRDLAPTYMATSEFDPLRDECFRYAERLLDAGVSVELHHYARAFHSFDSFSATRWGAPPLQSRQRRWAPPSADACPPLRRCIPAGLPLKSRTLNEGIRRDFAVRTLLRAVSSQVASDSPVGFRRAAVGTYRTSAGRR